VKINLDITFTDGVKKLITCNAADMVAFEDKFDISVAKLSGEPRIGWMFFLAWHSEKRTKQTELDFDKWLETVEQVGASDTDPKSEG
jgi:hypothetical protein